MSITTEPAGAPGVLEQLSVAEKQRRTEKAEAYEQLVAAIDGGKDRGMEGVEAILSDAGKTSDDLRADVQLCGKRRAWVEILRKRPAAVARYKELSHKQQSMRDDLENLILEKRAEIDAIDTEINACRRQMEEADRAGDQLRQRAPEGYRAQYAEMREHQKQFYESARIELRDAAEFEVETRQARQYADSCGGRGAHEERNPDTSRSELQRLRDEHNEKAGWLEKQAALKRSGAEACKRRGDELGREIDEFRTSYFLS